MPDGTRVDNFHGFMHIHLEHNGKKHSIIENKTQILKIIIKHIERNKKIIKKGLLEELR
nr:hypothetical protein [Methanobrevibacter arboriphilus]